MNREVKEYIDKSIDAAVAQYRMNREVKEYIDKSIDAAVAKLDKPLQPLSSASKPAAAGFAFAAEESGHVIHSPPLSREEGPSAAVHVPSERRAPWSSPRGPFGETAKGGLATLQTTSSTATQKRRLCQR